MMRARWSASVHAAITIAIAAHPLMIASAQSERPARTTREAYDHRAPADPGAEDAWRWIPRIALMPLRFGVGLLRESARLVLEPIGPPPSSPDAEEERQAPLFAMPVLHIETDVTAAVGAWARIIPDERLRIDVVGQHWDDARVEGTVSSRLALDRGGELSLLADASTRGDRLFHAIGDDPESPRRRYRHHRGGAEIGWHHDSFFRSSEVGLFGRVTHHRFDETGWGGEREPSLTVQDAPLGFASGATVLEPRLAIAIDSRAPQLGAGTQGVALLANIGVGSDVENGAHWTRAEARAEATLSFAREHDLTLSGWAASVDAFDGEAPFVELVILGGEPGALSGFPRGRLHGASAAIASLRYRWGVHQDADAGLHVELGNVYGESFDDLAIDRARASFGITIDGLADDEHRLGVLLALGTEPLDRGGGPASGHFRFFVGSPPR